MKTNEELEIELKNLEAANRGLIRSWEEIKNREASAAARHQVELDAVWALEVEAHRNLNIRADYSYVAEQWCRFAERVTTDKLPENLTVDKVIAAMKEQLEVCYDISKDLRPAIIHEDEPEVIHDSWWVKLFGGRK